LPIILKSIPRLQSPQAVFSPAIIVVKLFSLYHFRVQMVIDKPLSEVHAPSKGRISMNSIFAMNAYYSYFYYYRGSCGVSDER
jgi:hypothetical protein